MVLEKTLPVRFTSLNINRIEGKAKETLHSLDNMMDCVYLKSVLAGRTDKDYIIVSKRLEDPKMLHFDVYSHSGENTDRFVVQSQDGEVVRYACSGNKNANPVVERISSLLVQLGEKLSVPKR